MRRSRAIPAAAMSLAMLFTGSFMAGSAEAYNPPTANSAGTKPVNQRTNAWGWVPGGDNVDVWTEANLGSHWSKSQQTETEDDGTYVLPLTYGSNTPGTHEFRVVARHDDGSVVHSQPFTLTRTASPTVSSAGSKPVGQATNSWGTFQGGNQIPVWTEVYRGGVWAKSQERTTTSWGSYVIPLTYGSNTAGTYRYRVAGLYPDGTVLRTREFTLTRTAVAKTSCASASKIESELTRQAVTVLRDVCNTFPDIDTYLGYRGSAGSYHSTGRAIDIMVSGSRGWDVAHHLQRNASELGVIEVIYERRIWTTQRAGDGWRWMSDRGSVSANHYDHVHVSVGA